MQKLSFRLLVLFLFSAVSFINAQSQESKFWTPDSSPLALKSWNQLKGVPLRLISYGLCENGNFINNFDPEEQGFVEGGVLTTAFGGLKFWKSITGNKHIDIKFTARVDGLTLYTSSPDEDILWHKILKVGRKGKNYILVTVDNRNTGRFWLIDIDNYKKKNNLTL